MHQIHFNTYEHALTYQSGNNITDKDGAFVEEALTLNTTLTHLNLSHNNIEEVGAVSTYTAIHAIILHLL